MNGKRNRETDRRRQTDRQTDTAGRPDRETETERWFGREGGELQQT
jgi:hypothetical protein